MNYEKAMVVDYLRKFWLYGDNEVDAYILLSSENVAEGQGDEWQGIIKTIKKTNEKLFGKTHKKIGAVRAELNLKIDEFKTGMTSVKEKLDVLTKLIQK